MSTITEPAKTEPAAAMVTRLGAVSYLNTLPLIEGLGKLRDVSLTLTAPSRLIDLLIEGSVDMALASVIDAQRSPPGVPLALIPAGMIGCDGPTLTVRVFSRVPIERITRVHADADSHTSIALLRIVLAERYGLRPELIDFDAAGAGFTAAMQKDFPESLLLIGDKVVTDSPPAALYPHQLDLGEAWKELTGQPFLYAVWMCRADRADEPGIRTVAAILDRQRRHNAMRLGWIAAARAPARAWPTDLADHYLRDLMKFEVTDEHRDAVERFFDLCVKHGVLDEKKPVQWAQE